MTKLKENKILIKESRIKIRNKKKDWITYKKEEEEEEVQFVIFKSGERKKKKRKEKLEKETHRWQTTQPSTTSIVPAKRERGNASNYMVNY
jgi:hypothetical protein